MKTFKALEVERIADSIYRAIIEQRLKAGTRLVETRLADIFSANRNHVRAAIEQLSVRGVVRVETNKGAFVASPDASECREIFEARHIIECGIIAGVAAKCTAEQRARLQAIINKEVVACDNNDRQGLVRETGEFHLELARLYDNSRLYGILELLVASSSLVAGLYEKNDDFHATISEHRQIFHAIEKQQYSSLPELMGLHLLAVKNRLLMRYQERELPDLEAIFS